MSHFCIPHQTHSLVNVHMEHLVISGAHFDPGGEPCIPNFPLWVHPCIYPTWKYLHIVRRYFDGCFLLGTWVGYPQVPPDLWGCLGRLDMKTKRKIWIGQTWSKSGRRWGVFHFRDGTGLYFKPQVRRFLSMNFWFLTCSDTDNKSHWFQFNYLWMNSFKCHLL